MAIEQAPRTEVYILTARLVEACRQYTEVTGRYLYVDIYPIDPHFKDTNEYTYELSETTGGLNER